MQIDCFGKIQVQILSNKADEQDGVAQVHKKRIQDNLIRVQAMTQEIQALSTEITERNQTIYEKVTISCSSSLSLSCLLFRPIVSEIWI